MAKKQSIALVENRYGELVVESRIVAQRLGVDHGNWIRNVVKKYQTEIEEFGQLRFENGVGKRVQGGGNPEIFYWFTEPQITFVIMLSRNNEKVLQFKKDLNKQFHSMRRVLQQRQNAAWQQARVEGKVARHEETDTIKEFIAYAIAQGSQSAEKYYMNITKMENQALFLVEQKYPNLREVLSEVQLGSLKVCDRVVARALKEGMEQELHYKECYKLAKDRVVTFAEVVGKSLVPAGSLVSS